MTLATIRVEEMTQEAEDLGTCRAMLKTASSSKEVVALALKVLREKMEKEADAK